jgi:DHA1 family tetracycline resistance protein-like MFS transporter
LEWLFIGRILAGFFGANISTAYAYVADVTTDQDRAKGMGMIGAAFGLGFIFGPAIGGVLSRYGYSVPMFVGAAMALGNCIFAFAKLGEPNLSPELRSKNRSKRFDLNTIRLALEDGRSRFAIGAFFLLTFAVTQMEVTFAIYLGAKFGYNAEQAGILLAVMGIVMVLVQGMLIGKLVKCFGETRLVLMGTALCSVALAIFAATNSLGVIIAALIFLAFGHGSVHPSLSSLASKGASPHSRGATMGVFHSASSLARIIGPPVAGFLYDHLGGRSPFYCGAIILAADCAITAFFMLRAPETNGDEVAAH